jgi:hypothetical protein
MAWVKCSVAYGKVLGLKLSRDHDRDREERVAIVESPDYFRSCTAILHDVFMRVKASASY